MARVVFITLAFIGITLLGIHLMRGNMLVEQLSRDMAQLLAAFQHWHIWAFPGVLILFFGLMWCVRKTQDLPGSSIIIWICAAILVVFLKTFIFLMQVARKVFIALAFMGIIRLAIHLTCGNMYEQVQLHMLSC